MGTSDVGDMIPGLDEAGRIHGHEYERREDARKEVSQHQEAQDVRRVEEARLQQEVGREDQQRGGEEGQAQEVMRFADAAMYAAAPMPELQPRVFLLWMTPDPLGAIAAMSGMYEGKVFRSLGEISNVDRQHYWEEMTKTHLNAPLESVKMHFLIEGVDRAFTHQLVRQRTAVYAQESLRFAVKENLAAETPKPPSFYDQRVATSPSKQNDLFAAWDTAMEAIHQSYRTLIANGVPAEDARGLLPQATLTRIHYVTDLRNLLEHAGNRLCTQAQFHWRSVFMQIRECIRSYDPGTALGWDDTGGTMEHDDMSWQFGLIADTAFKPQCYLQGKCTFRADFDRGCTIRSRVDQFAAKGVPSSEWGSETVEFQHPSLHPIYEEEWLTDPQAGWVR